MARWLLLALALLSPSLALARTPAELRRLVHAEARQDQCLLAELRIIHRGRLPGESRLVTVVLIRVETCGGGGNNTSSQAEAYLREGGRLRQLLLVGGPDHPDHIERIRIKGSDIIVEGLSHAPEAGNCCPSLRRIQAYTITNGRVSPGGMR